MLLWYNTESVLLILCACSALYIYYTVLCIVCDCSYAMCTLLYYKCVKCISTVVKDAITPPLLVIIIIGGQVKALNMLSDTLIFNSIESPLIILQRDWAIEALKTFKAVSLRSNNYFAHSYFMPCRQLLWSDRNNNRQGIHCAQHRIHPYIYIACHE